MLRKRRVEEYLIEGVNLSWRNKSGVEGIVEKWTLVVKDTQGNEIHRTENSDLNNRKNNTDVTLNVFTDKTFGDNIIGNNTIDIYYNDGSGDKLINTQILRFEKDEFNEDISSFEFRNLDMSSWENAQNKDCEGIYSKVKKDKSTPGVEKFGCGPSDDPNKHNCQFWEYKHTQKQLGTGKPSPRNEGHVIKVQWPKKANTDRVGLQFVDDPDPNTDSKVADTPQHYKSLFDQQQAVVDEQEKENAKIAKEAADKAAAEAFGGLIPNQTKLGDDGWCGHGGVVIHQVDGDVNTAKGCKRICSDINQVWTRDTSYGKWDSTEANRIVEECTDAKLDIIWEKDGDGKRKLRSGFTASKDYVPPSTSSEPMNLSGGFKWYYYKGSYFSDVNSFSGKTPTKQGENVTDFSSKHKATGGHLRNDGNEDNYAVKWEGFFVPKKTGSHKFWTESDDMSYLYVNDILVVDNGGLHGMVKKSGSINLTADEKYPIKIYFSEKGGGDELKVWFQGPGMSSAIHNFSGYMLK
jgi:fibro-slime domain-containing protein